MTREVKETKVEYKQVVKSSDSLDPLYPLIDLLSQSMKSQKWIGKAFSMILIETFVQRKEPLTRLMEIIDPDFIEEMLSYQFKYINYDLFKYFKSVGYTEDFSKFLEFYQTMEKFWIKEKRYLTKKEKWQEVLTVVKNYNKSKTVNLALDSKESKVEVKGSLQDQITIKTVSQISSFSEVKESKYLASNISKKIILKKLGEYDAGKGKRRKIFGWLIENIKYAPIVKDLMTFKFESESGDDFSPELLLKFVKTLTEAVKNLGGQKKNTRSKHCIQALVQYLQEQTSLKLVQLDKFLTDISTICKIADLVKPKFLKLLNFYSLFREDLSTILPPELLSSDVFMRLGNDHIKGFILLKELGFGVSQFQKFYLLLGDIPEGKCLIICNLLKALNKKFISNKTNAWSEENFPMTLCLNIEDTKERFLNWIAKCLKIENGAADFAAGLKCIELLKEMYQLNSQNLQAIFSHPDLTSLATLLEIFSKSKNYKNVRLVFNLIIQKPEFSKNITNAMIIIRNSKTLEDIPISEVDMLLLIKYPNFSESIARSLYLIGPKVTSELIDSGVSLNNLDKVAYAIAFFKMCNNDALKSHESEFLRLIKAHPDYGITLVHAFYTLCESAPKLITEENLQKLVCRASDALALTALLQLAYNECDRTQEIFDRGLQVPDILRLVKALAYLPRWNTVDKLLEIFTLPITDVEKMAELTKENRLATDLFPKLLRRNEFHVKRLLDQASNPQQPKLSAMHMVLFGKGTTGNDDILNLIMEFRGGAADQKPR